MEKSRGRILIVDDDPSIRETIGDILEARGYSVHLACSAAEALEIAWNAPCDVALVDLRLPNTDGLELIKKLKESSPGTDAVLITAYASVDSAIEAMKEGALGYITKPADPEQVLMTLERALEKQRLAADNRRMLERLSAVLSSTRAIASKLHLKEAIGAILSEGRRILEACTCAVWILDGGGRDCWPYLSEGYSSDEIVRLKEERRATVGFKAAVESQEVIIPDLERQEFQPEKVFMQPSPAFRGVFAVPLKLGEATLGSMVFTYSQPKAPTEWELELARTFASHAAIAIQNAKCFERSQEQVSRLKALAVAAKRVTSELELKGALKAVMEEGSRVLGADRCAFFMLDEGTGRFELLLHRGLSERYLSEVLSKCDTWYSREVLASGEPAAFKDVRTAPELRHVWEASEREGIRSMILLPLRYRERAIGILAFYHDDPQPYTPADLDLAMTFAHQAAIAIQNADTHSRLEASFQELRRIQEMTIRAQKLAAIGRLTAGATHEILNPTNTISMHAQELLVEPEDPAAVQNSAEVIQRNVKRIAKICGGLRRFSRVAKPAIRKFDLREVIRETVTMLEHQTRLENVTFSVELPQTPLLLEADQDQIVQVLLNLINNARDAMPEGGNITLSAEAYERDGARSVRMCVIDEGVGIPTEELSSIFDPFFTKKDEEKGTGLGLSIVHGIIENHGGLIDVQSEVGRGTRLRIELPVHHFAGSERRMTAVSRI